jgi:hypothetical protein
MQQPRAKNLRQHADEARAMADRMQDTRTRRTMWNLACSYDLLARHAEVREDLEHADIISHDRKPGGRDA